MSKVKQSLSLQQADLSACVSLLLPTENSPALAPEILLKRPTSLDTTTAKGKIRFLNAVMGHAIAARDIFGVELNVTDYLLIGKKDGKPREDGRDVYGCLYLILTDGTSVRVTSEEVIKNFPLVFSLFGMGPWNPPIALTVNGDKAKKSGNEFHYLQFCDAVNDEDDVDNTERE